MLHMLVVLVLHQQMCDSGFWNPHRWYVSHGQLWSLSGMISSHIEWPWQLYTGNGSIICHLWYLLNLDRNSSRAFQAPWYPRVMRKSHVSQRMVTPRNLEVRNPSNAALQVSLSPSNPTFSPLRGSFGQIFYWGQHGVNFHPIIPTSPVPSRHDQGRSVHQWSLQHGRATPVS